MSTKMNKKGLGRGLDSLFGEAAVESVRLEDERASGDQGAKEITRLKLTEIEPNGGQPRSEFDEEALAELAASIAQNGIIQPLAVRRMPNGRYQIIAGERRWRAARLAGISELPVVVLDVDDAKAMELALIENLQRENLNPVEEAMGYKTLLEKYGLTQEEASERIGKSRSAVANSVRLLSLPQEVLKLLSDGAISSGHARSLLSLSEASEQQSVAEKIVAQALSVRQTEQLVKKMNQEIKEEAPAKELTVNYLEVLQLQLGERLGRKVKIVHGKKRGRIELEYYGQEDLNLLSALILNLKQKD